MLNTMSKIRGQVKNPGYPQAEGLLGECMAKYGRDLGEETNFGEKPAFDSFTGVEPAEDRRLTLTLSDQAERWWMSGRP